MKQYREIIYSLKVPAPKGGHALYQFENSIDSFWQQIATENRSQLLPITKHAIEVS